MEIRLCPFDPIEWLNRLREVNARSQFTPKQRKMIEEQLVELQKKLEEAHA